MGMVFTHIDDMHQYKESFHKKVKRELKKQIDIVDSKYCENQKESRYKFLTLILLIITTICGIVSAIPIVFPKIENPSTNKMELALGKITHTGWPCQMAVMAVSAVSEEG